METNSAGDSSSEECSQPHVDARERQMTSAGTVVTRDLTERRSFVRPPVAPKPTRRSGVIERQRSQSAGNSDPKRHSRIFPETGELAKCRTPPPLEGQVCSPGDDSSLASSVQSGSSQAGQNIVEREFPFSTDSCSSSTSSLAQVSMVGSSPPSPLDSATSASVSSVSDAKLSAAAAEKSTATGSFPYGGDRLPMIVVFGSAGVGKSSIINLLTDKKYPIKTSASAKGVTFECTGWPHVANGVTFVDTAGLNETTAGTVSAEDAAKKLVQFLLAIEVGISLFIMVKAKACGGRISQNERENYEMFVSKLASNRVPCVLVMTGCELDRDLQGFFTDEENTKAYTECGLHFKRLVCAAAKTDAEPGDPCYELWSARLAETYDAVWKAIRAAMSPSPVKLYETKVGMLTIAKRVVILMRDAINRLSRGLRLTFTLKTLSWEKEGVKLLLMNAGHSKEEAEKVAEAYFRAKHSAS